VKRTEFPAGPQADADGVSGDGAVAPLTALLAPRGIVLMGASASPEKLGAVMERSLRRHPAPLALVNARRPDATRDHHATALDAAHHTGGVYDLAVLCVPAAHSADALADAARVGVRAAVVCSGGFSESGPEGAAHEAQLLAVAKEHGIRVLGPNTSGFFSPQSRLFASFVPATQQLSPGPVAVVAASGGVNHALSFLLADAGVGVSYGIGLGLGVDIDAADALEHLAHDARTEVVVLHLEAVADGPRLLRAARRVAERKPLVALVVGEQDVSGFAASHTGALATSWRTTRSLLHEAGALLVRDERELVDAVAALARVPVPAVASPGVALVTAQAGPGLMALDRLKHSGVDIPPLGDATLAALAELLPPMTYQQNPVDTGRPGPAHSEVIVRVAADPAVDLVATYTLEEPDSIDVVAAMQDASDRAAVPVLVGIGGVGPSVAAVRDELRVRGLATFDGPTGLANGVRAVVERARTVARLGARTDAVPSIPGAPHGREVAALLRSGPLDEDAAKGLLERFGLRAPARRACTTRDEAHAFLADLGRSVGVKILDASITHKSDIGGVVLGVRTPAELDDALDRIERVGARAFLVEEMAGGGVDLLVGAHRDPVFGPVVLLGLGGVTAEALDDVALRSAPVAAVEVAGMVDELAGRELLRGFRGLPVVDPDELARVLSVLGALVTEHDAVAAVEVNPLRATADGLLMLDAVVLMEEGPDGA
jgi:acyl-CoA synthetase (NDP forming)